MTRETGARKQRSALLGLAAFLAFAAAPPIQAQTPTTASESSEDSSASAIDGALAAIAKAFRTERADALNSILPAVGKIYISLESVGGGPAGYYGRDQVYFIVNDIFKRIDTVTFDIRQGGSKTKGRVSPIHGIGNWQYRRNDSRTSECQIHFVLSLNGDDWSLVQIREAL